MGNPISYIDPFGLQPDSCGWNTWEFGDATGCEFTSGDKAFWTSIALLSSYGLAGPTYSALLDLGLLPSSDVPVAGKMCTPKKLNVPNDLPRNIHFGQQGKHLPGSNNFDKLRSPLNSGINPQELLDGIHSGKYPIVRMAGDKRIVNFGKDIGTYNGKATRYGIVHYGPKKGAHIRPANPIQY